MYKNYRKQKVGTEKKPLEFYIYGSDGYLKQFSISSEIKEIAKDIFFLTRQKQSYRHEI
jgi:hypothetical protein